MTTLQWGILLGAVAGGGLWLVTGRVAAIRRGAFDARVLRPLADMRQLHPDPLPASAGPLSAVLGPVLRSAAASLERAVGGSASVARRIERAGLTLTVGQFRVEQVSWGLAAFAGAVAVAMLVALQRPERWVPLAALTLLAFVAGVLWRDNRLSSQVRTHEERVLAELPAVAELLALSVAAGEGIVAALERVVRRSGGALSRDLTTVLGEIRTGVPVALAFDDYSRRTGLPAMARFASAISVSVERGTPLADVLHAQAGDVREAHRRALIESGARREVAMMVPVVFLVLPTTILFAFWPGVVGLRLVSS